MIKSGNKNSFKYTISGFDPTIGEIPFDDKTVSDPEKAVEYWYKMNSKYPTCVNIEVHDNESALRLIEWSHFNKDKIKSFSTRYKSPYKVDYILSTIDGIFKSGAKFTHFPDSIFPYSMG